MSLPAPETALPEPEPTFMTKAVIENAALTKEQAELAAELARIRFPLSDEK